MIRIFKNFTINYSGHLRLFVHVLFWIIMSIFFTSLKKAALGLPLGKMSVIIAKDIFVIAIVFYFLAYYIFPQLILKKKFLFTVIALIAVYYFYATMVFLEFSIFPKFLTVPGQGYQAYSSRVLAKGFTGILKLANAPEILLDMTYLLAPALIIKLFATLMTLSRQALRLEMENLNLELAFLKAQINPHFLFNTLNNVYSLALVRSEKAADAVLKLSDLMRYTLYESNTPKVALEREIRFFRNYIELERMRHNKKVEIVFEIEGIHDGLYIAPLIIFPFIENAFKHGIDSTFLSSWVKIKINVSGGTLDLIIRNSRFPAPDRPNLVGGIGVPNAIKRLSLMYPNKHVIDIRDENNVFSVALRINLI